MKSAVQFPPKPKGLKGRSRELKTLTHMIEETAPTRIALVGSGGSGKSMLACALGYHLARRFADRVHWFRVGRWDFRTILEMLARGFGTSRARDELAPKLHRALKRGGERLVVLDNHEDDEAMARVLDLLADTPVTVVITARRCLLAGVLIFPVIAPLVTAGETAFPRVARLTRILRWNPLALDIADAMVQTRAASVSELESFLERERVDRVCVIDHEDDLPEVRLLVRWAWDQLRPESRRMLGVLAHSEGDHMDSNSLAQLASVKSGAARALAPLKRWHLVQEPVAGRHTLHAVVRHAVLRWTKPNPNRMFRHYMALLEQFPSRMLVEQTHLYAAMDHAHRTGNLSEMLRVESLLERLDGQND